VPLLAARAFANGLGAVRARTVVDAVSAVVGLQGQDVRANRLAVRVRTDGLTATDVDDAVARGDVVRTWAMRGTLHMVAAGDLGWLLREVGAYFLARQAPRRRQLGLPDAACERGAGQLAAILTEPRTRAEIVERVDLDLHGQAAPYFLSYAALSGLICRGPERGAEPTYVLAHPVDNGDELALRYLRGHGPSHPRDLAAWSGLPLTRSRTAFDTVRDLLRETKDGFVVADAAEGEATEVRLLGHFDAYLLGYRDRPVPPEHAKAIQSGGGFVMPAISVGGRIVGTWRRVSTQDRIEVTQFTTVPAGLDAEVADLDRFLGRPSGHIGPESSK
jgi:hypothetical protein